MGKLKASDFESDLELKKNTKLNTSEQKAKKINYKDIKTLIERTKDLQLKWIQPAIVWVVANILVGLRPIEWRQAELVKWDNHQLMLKVVNAKNSNNRAHGEFRHIDCSYLNSVELGLLRKQLSISSSNSQDDKSWQNYYEGCRKTIHAFTRKYLSKRKKYPTLYSTRHQFAANAKSAGMSKVEVAALLGHATDQTAGFHYGKKKHGSGGCKVKGVRADMQ